MRRRLLDDGGGGKVGRKTFGLLKTSWLYQTKQFFDNSSLHGVRYIAEEGRPTIEKLMWFVFVLSGAIVTLIIIASLWEKFQTNPTITGLDTDFHSWDVPFPGVSICPTSPANSTLIEEYVAKKWDKVTDQTKLELYTKFVNDVANLSYATLANMAEYGKVPELRKMSQLRELLYSVVEKCEDLLKDCNWKGEAYSCCQGFKPTFTENGFCYTFNSIHVEKTWPWKSAQTVTDTQVNYIYETDSKWAVSFDVFELKNNTLKIFIHSYDELPGVDMAPQHIWNRKVNSIYFASRTTYTTNDARQLSPKQRKCVFEDEIKLPTHDKYSYWGCMTHCRMAYARSKCSCVPFFYHKVDGFPYCDVEGLSCLAEYTEDMGASMNCPCMLGCMNVVYEVEKVTDVTSERLEPLEVGFVSWPMIQYKREVLFGWVDLLGESNIFFSLI
ncbi:hypothetical protein AAG570_004977 [Ranatra chinensis]|uniref:Sodium channel protein Nach n=1 Tax=Ranatra chinensis TaxID=642074 RepID=A0ABD0Y0Q3_9HEMI